MSESIPGIAPVTIPQLCHQMSPASHPNGTPKGVVMDDDAPEPTTAMTALDPDRLDAFVRTIASTIDGALHAVTVLVGDRLGLYRAMADGEPIDDRELAARTGTSVEFVAVWLASQAAAGYVGPRAGGRNLLLAPGACRRARHRG